MFLKKLQYTLQSSVGGFVVFIWLALLKGSKLINKNKPEYPNQQMKFFVFWFFLKVKYELLNLI